MTAKAKDEPPNSKYLLALIETAGKSAATKRGRLLACVILFYGVEDEVQKILATVRR